MAKINQVRIRDIRKALAKRGATLTLLRMRLNWNPAYRVDEVDGSSRTYPVHALKCLHKVGTL